MKKRLLDLGNVQLLTKEEQKRIKGKGDEEYITCDCPNGSTVIVLSTITCPVAEVLYCPQDM